MAATDYYQRECEQFLQERREWGDSTWGFYVYGTYARPQGQGDADGDSDENEITAKEAADGARFQAVLSKLHAHAADNLRYSQPAPYNQQLIDTLRLEPAAYLPGASLADVCEHFRQHYAITDRDDPLNDENDKFGPKYDWCLVINDEALQSIESAPQPIGPTPPEGVELWKLASQAYDAFVILLHKNHITMEEPEILAQTGRGGIYGNGHTIDWYGWLKFSPVDLMQVFTESSSADDIKSNFKHNDKIVRF